MVRLSGILCLLGVSSGWFSRAPPVCRRLTHPLPSTLRCLLEDPIDEQQRSAIRQFRNQLRLQEIQQIRRAAAAASRPLPFQVARETVQLHGLRTQREWKQWFRNNRKSLRQNFITFYKDGPGVMPERPDEIYASEWQGWDDFLGVLLPYSEAKRVAASLGIASQEDWWDFVRANDKLLLRLRIPSSPHLYYRGQWEGYAEWLGQPSKPLFFSSDSLD